MAFARDTRAMFGALDEIPEALDPSLVDPGRLVRHDVAAAAAFPARTYTFREKSRDMFARDTHNVISPRVSTSRGRIFQSSLFKTSTYKFFEHMVQTEA